MTCPKISTTPDFQSALLANISKRYCFLLWHICDNLIFMFILTYLHHCIRWTDNWHRPYYPSSRFRRPSEMVVRIISVPDSSRPLCCLPQEMGLGGFRSVSMWQGSDDVPHLGILSPNDAACCGLSRFIPLTTLLSTD